jgi:hypothetical protein
MAAIEYKTQNPIKLMVSPKIWQEGTILHLYNEIT